MSWINESEISPSQVDYPFAVLAANARDADLPHAVRALERMRESAQEIRFRNLGMIAKVVFTTGTYRGEESANDVHIVTAAKPLLYLIGAPIEVPEQELIPGSDLLTSNQVGFPMLARIGDPRAYNNKNEILLMAGVSKDVLPPSPDQLPRGVFAWETNSDLRITEVRKPFELRLRGARIPQIVAGGS